MRNIVEARAADAPRLHDSFFAFGNTVELKDNVCQSRHVTRGDAAKALAESAFTVTQRFTTPFTEHAFLEPECAVAFPYKNGVKVQSTDQGAYDTRKECAHMFGWDSEPERVVVETMLVGGGFGGKEDVSIQHLAALAAYKFQRPVKCKLTRAESLAFHPKRHAMDGTFTLGCDAEGNFTGLDCEINFDTGAYASRQTYVTGKAIKKVGEEFREKLLAYAAELFPDASGLDIRERQVVDGAGEALISLADLAMNAFYSLEHSVHITAEDTNHCKENTFAFGCCFAEVEVDIPVGKVRVLRIVNVHDSGKLINPALAEAQVHGGMSMGIGYALTEEMKFDPKTGRLLNGNLLDYKMPTSMDHPELTALFVETDDPSGPFGNKALGEPPTIPVAPAIRNAVLQATGVAVNTLPLSPQKLVEEFTRGGLI